MALSSELISQFVKATKDETETKKESIVYGTAVEYGGKMYARLDGSDRLTPITSTAGVRAGDRVTVVIKNHSAILTGNVSSPSASKDDVEDAKEEIGNQISEFEIIIADKVSTTEFDAQVGRIDELTADNVLIKGELEAASADIDQLKAKDVDIEGTLTAANAEIENLKTTKIDAEIADITYAKVGDLEATNAEIHNLTADYGEFKDLTTDKLTAADADIKRLDTEKLDADEAEIKYANVDFANIGMAAIENLFTKSGIIGNLVVGDTSITGTLVGVTIKGDLIEGGTVKADKLVVQGTDGLYYKLNVTGETVATEQTEYNSLNGSIITAKSITAEKVNVHDLVAFGATIGGFHITDSSIYSGVKSSVNNTTRGSYMDDDGQFAIGDSTNFLKFYKDTDGSYKLAISASQITLGTKNLASSDDVQEIVDNLEIGGTNLIKNSNFKYELTHWVNNYPKDSSRVLESSLDYIGQFFQATQTKAYPTDADVCRIYASPSSNFAHTNGEQYTLSFYGAILNDDFESRSIIASVGGDAQRIIKCKVSKANNWELFTITYTANNAGSLTFYSDVLETIFQLANIKLEKGNKATDWSPSPKDIEADLENNYYDKTEVDSKIEITKEGITSSVREEVSKIEIGGENLLLKTKEFLIDNSESGGLHSASYATTGDTYRGLAVRGTNSVPATSNPQIGHEMVRYTLYNDGSYNYGDRLTFSFWVKGTLNYSRCFFYGNTDYVKVKVVASSTGYKTNSYTDGAFIFTPSQDWKRVWVTWELDSSGDLDAGKTALIRTDLGDNEGSLYICGCKLEKGNKPTDWSPAPEDMATGEEVENAQASADEANATADSTESRVTVAETTIQQLSDSISQLVTDENGNSLMTQTSEGWTFNMGAVNSSLKDAQDTLKNLSGSVDGVEGMVDKLDSLVNDLTAKTAYIVMTTDDTGAPCIELGKSDNPFKVRITNTSVDFLEGTSKIAYISNQALYIERAVVKNEFKIGDGTGWIWKKRANNHLGLRYE